MFNLSMLNALQGIDYLIIGIIVCIVVGIIVGLIVAKIKGKNVGCGCGCGGCSGCPSVNACGSKTQETDGEDRDNQGKKEDGNV